MLRNIVGMEVEAVFSARRQLGLLLCFADCTRETARKDTPREVLTRKSSQSSDDLPKLHFTGEIYWQPSEKQACPEFDQSFNVPNVHQKNCFVLVTFTHSITKLVRRRV